MATKKLNDRRVDGLKPRAERYTVNDGGGLGLRVGPTGRKTWFMVYRDHGGRQRRQTLGTYPAVSLASARTMHAEKLEAVGLGRNIEPASQRGMKMTLTDLWRQFDEAHVEQRLKPKTQSLYRDFWKNHIAPALGRRRIVEITRADVRAMHAELGRAGKTRSANLAVAVVRSMLSHAIDQELLAGPNPAVGVKLYDEPPRERYLNPDEIGRLYAALEADATDLGDWTWHDLVKLLLLTGARRGNVQSMRWQDIDWQGRRWMIPGSHTKTKRLYLVELPRGAVEILDRRRRDAEADHQAKLAEAREAGTSAPERSPWVFPSVGKSGHLECAKNAWNRIRTAADLCDVRMHDLRHTHASVMINGGTSLAIVGAQLGHSRAETTQRYAHLIRETVAVAVETAMATLDASPEQIDAEVVEDE